MAEIENNNDFIDELVRMLKNKHDIPEEEKAQDVEENKDDINEVEEAAEEMPFEADNADEEISDSTVEETLELSDDELDGSSDDIPDSDNEPDAEDISDAVFATLTSSDDEDQDIVIYPEAEEADTVEEIEESKLEDVTPEDVIDESALSEEESFEDGNADDEDIEVEIFEEEIASDIFDEASEDDTVSYDAEADAEPEDAPQPRKIELVLDGEESDGAVDNNDEDKESHSRITLVEYSEEDDAANYAQAEGGHAEPDYNMLIALGVPYAEVEKVFGHEAAEKYTSMKGETITEVYPNDRYEYSSSSQDDEINEFYKSEKTVSLIKLIGTAVFAVLLLLFENLPFIGIEFGGALNASVYPVIGVLIDLQLLLLCGAFVYENLFSGFLDIFDRKPGFESLVAVMSLFTLFADIALCFIGGGINMAGSALAFAFVLIAYVEFRSVRAEKAAFDIASDEKYKFFAKAEYADSTETEVSAFGKLLRGDVHKIVSIGKCNNISSFFQRSEERTLSLADKVVFPLSLVFSIAIFIISFVISKDAKFAIGAFSSSLFFLFPASVFASAFITINSVKKAANDLSSAIIGDLAPAEYSEPEVITFEDRDAFPSHAIRLRNLKIYGSSQIEDVLVTSSVLFRKLGGPLADVFFNAIAEDPSDKDIEIDKVTRTGIYAHNENGKILVGRAQFMEDNGIIPFEDTDDIDLLRGGDVSTMFLAQNGELCAKFYIQYTVDVDFELTLKRLNRNGICVAIRTSDPNITNELLGARFNLNKVAVRVVPPYEEDTVVTPKDKVDAGIISLRSSHELVETVLLCDKLSHALKTNNIIKALSLFLGTMFMMFFVFLSSACGISSFLLVLYMIFWMLPTYLVTKLFI